MNGHLRSVLSLVVMSCVVSSAAAQSPTVAVTTPTALVLDVVGWGNSTSTASGPVVVTMTDVIIPGYHIYLQGPQTLQLYKDGTPKYVATISLTGAPVTVAGGIWTADLAGPVAPSTSAGHNLQLTASITRNWTVADLAGDYTGTLILTLTGAN
ncbi:MAG: hypothetical protein IT204_23840 [Fimbriimonadaceae bacterium]|nr:hypothetical protein [Fimbriimonadaceae bacterium]